MPTHRTSFSIGLWFWSTIHSYSVLLLLFSFRMSNTNLALFFALKLCLLICQCHPIPLPQCSHIPDIKFLSESLLSLFSYFFVNIFYGCCKHNSNILLILNTVRFALLFFCAKVSEKLMLCALANSYLTKHYKRG